MDYNFSEVEKKWRTWWQNHDTYKTTYNTSKPKYYVLDMFPYPSGAGLHVGHPLGYIASDIFARYKRLKGFNVLHPMGYDAYGLPAEQYAIQTGQHPAITTEKNLNRYRQQLDVLGFSFDWSREVRTSDPQYYKWTQWTFIKLFHSWYNKKTDKAEPIESLIAEFEINGSEHVEAASSVVPEFRAQYWNNLSEKQQQEILMHFRLAYLADTMVNWCPALGTVLANDEVAEGFSVRGGHPVERKSMKQWLLRITAYAERLLNGLDSIDWPEPIKEVQRNWIGKSDGAKLEFEIYNSDLKLEVFTTRPDTIFGVSYMTLAPEHEFVEQIVTDAYHESVMQYIAETKNRSERERMADVKKISGCFTGAYAIHPFSGNKLPIWIGDYVLAGYGTGAVMAVPAHDSRDYAFAKHFGLDILEVVAGGDISQEAFDGKQGKLINSDFLNGMEVRDAMNFIIGTIEGMEIGLGKVNYRLRDAIFSRQRYWGEPFPVYYKEGIPYTLDASQLPLELPQVDAYLPTETGEPPLARAKNWKTKEGYPLETNTMPGFAGSSGYYLRYMDPHNETAYFSHKANAYWQNVDLYIGGAEHATGHLIYSRFWNKFLFDLGLTVKDEPFQKLINQGMIQGVSEKIYMLVQDRSGRDIIPFTTFDINNGVIGHYHLGFPADIYYSADIYTKWDLANDDNMRFVAIKKHINISLVNNNNVDIEKLSLINDMSNAVFVTNNGGFYYQGKFYELISGEWKEPKNIDLKDKFKSESLVEKMSKTYLNAINPDDLVEKYGADTLRLYEMFLGPLEMHKPWDTNGIEGVSRFMRKLWRLYHDHNNVFCVSNEEPTQDELRVLHKTIKKTKDDIERFSFNTAVSSFMICVNELTDLKCNKRKILSDFAIIISPFAPHIAEELWNLLGNNVSITQVEFPVYDEKYLSVNSHEYPVSFNGKMRFKLELPLKLSIPEIEKAVLSSKESEKWLTQNPPKKIIIIPGKIINIVV
ncbi:MAG: class I tRNA ligase family protein [Bacteroidota bacterium]